MSDEIEKLYRKVASLEEENREIKANYENSQQTMGYYEQIIGETNANLLRADMARMEFEQIFSAYTDAMWVIREDGVVLRANPAMYQMLGKTEDEVLGQKCSELLQYNLCSKKNCPLVDLSSPQTQEIDIQFHGEEDNRHYLLTTAPLVTLNGDPGVVAQFKDDSIRKQAEKALEKANTALAAMARTDGLTQIPNRRSFDEAIAREWSRLSRTQQPLSLLLGDIDFFKRYNDQYGHQAGDDCLRKVAKALQGALLRPADLAARYGGEEFSLLLPETEIEGAQQVGQRILDAVTALAIPHRNSDVRDSVSISLGAATLTPNEGQTPADLIAMADTALYQAKEFGRNQIFLAGQDLPQE